MRILLSWRMCLVGGLERWMVELARTYHMLGHECELFFFERGPFEEFIPPDVVAHFGNIEDCVRLVARRRFDVVHGTLRDWDLGITAVRQLGVKLVVHGHGWVHPAWNSSNCDAVLGCAQWNAQAQQALTDMPVQMIRNGIDLKRFPEYQGKVQGPPIVAWVGRSSELKQKQIDRLAAVAPLIRSGGARLWVADPDGPEKVPAAVAQVLKAEAERWEWIPPAEMVAFYHAVAATGGCLLSTSSFEGLSMAYLEGQACGCPIIGPDVVGVNESLDVKRGGVLYPAEISAPELAKLILSVLSDSEKMAWRRKASREFVAENCTFEDRARDYLKLYEAAPQKKQRSIGAWRRRMGCSPLLHWGRYVENRWRVGRTLYDLSERFHEEGQTELARAMARESMKTAPTIFIRGRRLRRWITVMRGARRSVVPQKVAGENR